MAEKRSKTSTGERAKVMVVDARGDELGGVCAQLTQTGLRVVELTRPEAAVPLYRFFRPDAAVLATSAPDYPEIALGKQLRFVSNGALPLFYVVDRADSLSRTYVIRKGHALDVFERPVSAEELAAKIEASVRLKCAIERSAVEQGDLRSSPLRDDVTGLYNRPYLLEALASEVRRCERHGGSFSIVRCRLEGLTRLRKALGRERTERLLSQVAAALVGGLREADVAARVGESEFALLLASCPAEAVGELVARAQARLSTVREDGGTRALVFSLGAASFPDVVGTPAQILGAAAAELARARMAAAVAQGPGLEWGKGGWGEERDV